MLIESIKICLHPPLPRSGIIINEKHDLRLGTIKPGITRARNIVLETFNHPYAQRWELIEYLLWARIITACDKDHASWQRSLDLDATQARTQVVLAISCANNNIG